MKIEGDIYKLVFMKPGTPIYIGSTTDSLHNRRKKHIHMSITGESKLYQAIREYGYFIIVSLEHGEYKDKIHLRERERYFIELYEPQLNTNSAHITEEEKRIQGNIWGMKKVVCEICKNEMCQRSLKRHHDRKHILQ